MKGLVSPELPGLCASRLRDPLLQWQFWGYVPVVFQHSSLTCFGHQCQNSLLSKHRHRTAKASRWKTKNWVRGSVWHAHLGCSGYITRESGNGTKLASTDLNLMFSWPWRVKEKGKTAGILCEGHKQQVYRTLSLGQWKAAPRAHTNFDTANLITSAGKTSFLWGLLNIGLLPPSSPQGDLKGALDLTQFSVTCG